jgi:hypothetical protein
MKYMNILKERANIYPIGFDDDKGMLEYYLDHPLSVFSGLFFEDNLSNITISMNNTLFDFGYSNYDLDLFLSLQKNLQLSYIQFESQYNLSSDAFDLYLKKFPEREIVQRPNCNINF